MHAVRTTMQPDKTFEVGDAEYLDLKRQGLLIEGGPPPEAPSAKPRAQALTRDKKES